MRETMSASPVPPICGARASGSCRLALASAAQGFTMIEVMIVLALIAILVSVALPAYNNQFIRSNRAATQGYLLDLANREELYLLDARTYTTSVNTLLPPPGSVSPYYTVTIAAPTGTTIANAFRITATPVTTSIQKNDGALTIDQDGQKTGTW
jgi:type IV pilus assembly protein PilE